jgi:hypothetical protein
MSAREEKRRFESKAKEPWPTKAQLSKRLSFMFEDTEGRRYYTLIPRYDSEELIAWSKEQESAFSNCIGFWVRLPKKTTMGGMPEQSNYVTAMNTDMKLLVLQSSVQKSLKQRGTGYVILQRNSQKA